MKNTKGLGVGKYIRRAPERTNTSVYVQYRLSLDRRNRLVVHNPSLSIIEVGIYLITILFFIGIQFHWSSKLERIKEFNIAVVETRRGNPEHMIRLRSEGYDAYYNSSLVRCYEKGDMETFERYAFRDAYGSPKGMMIFGAISMYGIILAALFFASKNCRDRVVFDREKSLVHYRCYYGLLNRTKPFDELVLQSISKSIHLGSGGEYLALRFYRPTMLPPIAMNYTPISVSFYVWYMDKNRPLPPSDLLDSLREADYLDRRDRKFPTPLYLSAVKTAEWEGAQSKYNDQAAEQRYNPDDACPVFYDDIY